MAEVNTDNYPKPPAPKSLMDNVQQMGAIQQQKIAVDQSQLKLMNDRYSILTRELLTLAGNPNVTAKDIVNNGQNLVKLGIIPAKMYSEFITQIPTDPTKVKPFLDNQLARIQETNAAINWQYGQPDAVNTGQRLQPGMRDLKTGAFNTSGPAVQMEVPPTATVRGQDGTPTMQGPTPPQVAPGVPLPRPRAAFEAPGANMPPAGPIAVPGGPSANLGGNVVAANAEPPTFNNRFKASYEPTGPATGLEPMAEQGMGQLKEAQTTAYTKSIQIKPAIKALRLIEENNLATGPLTGKINNVLAALKSIGIVSTDATNDPVAIRQQIEKYLSQYVGNNPIGQRSDAAQTLAKAGSPDPSVQINPALIQLTRDAVALDRIEILKGLSFEGKNFSKVGDYIANFAKDIDEKALTIDFMKPKERNELIEKMKKDRNSNTGKRFWRTLDLMDKHKLAD